MKFLILLSTLSIIMLLWVPTSSYSLMGSFGNVVEDGANYLYKGQFIDAENNPVWKALCFGIEDRQVYRQLHVPEELINQLLKAQAESIKMLQIYFRTFLVSPFTLEDAIKRYANILMKVNEHYLKDINNIVLGEDLEVFGSNNYVKSNNLKVYGSNSHIISDKYSHVSIRRNNIMRLGRYQLLMDRVDQIHKNPFQVIKILGLN